MRIGKEVDRLDEDQGVSLGDEAPLSYPAIGERALALDAMHALKHCPQASVATQLQISVRRWRDIAKGRAKPHPALRNAIIALARRFEEHP